MNWVFAHAYIVFLGVALFIIVATGAVIRDSDSTPVRTTNAGWGRAGGFSVEKPTNPNTNLRATTPLTSTDPVGDNYTPITIRTLFEEPSEKLLGEWQSLLNNLTAPSDTLPGAHEDPQASTDSYDFIPRGLISTPEPSEQKTQQQQELHTYGNRVGGFIRDFENFNGSMITTLKNAYEDRDNDEKRAAAERIGENYIRLGKDLEALRGIPSAVEKMHLAIARAYQAAGAQMIVKLRATSDEEFVTAMHAYNASALEFTNSFVALATYLSAAGVRFNTSEAGSVFTFTSF